MIKAYYKGQLVTGSWFCLGDNYWLLLTKAASKRVKKESISMDSLDKISSYPY